jgi:transposase InsO family protein
VQYLSIRYTERLAQAGIEPSVGSTGGSYDNALVETVIGLFKTEQIHRRGVDPVRWRVNCLRDRHGTSTEGDTDIAPPGSIVDPSLKRLVKRRLSFVSSLRV